MNRGTHMNVSARRSEGARVREGPRRRGGRG